MSGVLFAYPPQTAYGRILPKNKLYEHTRPSAALKALFVRQVEKIVWQHILATRTLNLPETAAVDEIKVFSLTLKTPDLHHDVLRCIDMAIPSPIIFELNADGRVQVVASYKRPSAADRTKWVVSDYFASPWLSAAAPRAPLPVALNLASLYEQLLQCLIPLPARAGESLAERVARVEQVRGKQRESDKISSRLSKEKQFNRKVEINAQLRAIKREIEELSR